MLLSNIKTPHPIIRLFYDIVIIQKNVFLYEHDCMKYPKIFLEKVKRIHFLVDKISLLKGQDAKKFHEEL